MADLPARPRPLVLALVLVVAAVAVLLAWRSARSVAEPVAVPQFALAEDGRTTTGATGAGPAADEPVPAESATPTVTVHVVGPVRRPGIVVLRDGARVADAVAAAGGMAQGAQAAAVNLARRLVDGERIDLHAPEAPQGSAVDAAPGSGAESSVDLNTATTEQLQDLPGVGPVLAERIVAYRQEHGGFDTVEQLQEVAGIGPSRLQELADLVTAGPR